MGTGSGVLSYCGAGVETTHKTPVTVDASLTFENLIPYLTEGITQEFVRIRNESLMGSAAERPDRQGPKIVQGPLEAHLCYDGFGSSDNKGYGSGILLALATQCGMTTTPGAGTPGDDTTSGGNNRYTPANDPLYFSTFAFDKVPGTSHGLYTLASAKIKSMRIFGTQQGDVRIAVELIGYDLRGYPRWGAGTAGEQHDLAAIEAAMVAGDDEPTIVAFHDMGAATNGGFYLGDRSNVLTSADKLGISEFEVTVDFGLSDSMYMTPDPDAAFAHTDAQKTLEHKRDAKRDVNVRLVIPRYVTDQWKSWHEDDTPLQFYFHLYGSATQQTWIRVPYGKITTEAFSVTGPELIVGNVNIKCFKPTGTVFNLTGKFSDDTDELKDENGIHTEIGIETDDARTDNPFGIS